MSEDQKSKNQDPSSGMFENTCPERVLWLSVIYQAVADATQPCKGKHEMKITSLNRATALRWLKGNSQGLKEVVDYAGLDYDYFKSRVHAILEEGGGIYYYRRTISNHIQETTND